MRTRRWVISAAAAIAVAAGAGCGGDDDGAGAADAAQPDARPVADAGDVPGTSAWEMVSCGADPDAGAPEADAAPEIDAAPDTPDAGLQPPDGLGDPCCDPMGGCNSGMKCISSTADDSNAGHCRPNCAGASGTDCPFGGVCADFAGQKICIEASGEGEDCAPELCEAGTICVGDDAESATCHRRCENSDVCEDGQTCQTLTGSDAMACL